MTYTRIHGFILFEIKNLNACLYFADIIWAGYAIYLTNQTADVCWGPMF